MLKVLIADDDPDVLALLEAILEHTGEVLELKTAADGAEALNIWLWYQPDLLISDLDMPNCNGAQLAAKIRDLEPGFPDRKKPTRLVLFSGDPDADRTVSDVFDYVIRKDDVALLSKLKIILGGV